MVTQMRHILEGGYSIIENIAGFAAYRGLTPLGTGFYKNRADAEMQIHLERKFRANLETFWKARK